MSLADDILTFWRQQLPLHENLSFRGEHKPTKLAAACQVHSIEGPESVLVLFDDTLFGGAKEGFVVTAKGFGFKTLGDEPRWIPFAQLHASDVHFDEGRMGIKVLVRGENPGLTNVEKAFQERLSETLRAMAGVGVRGAQNIYRSSPRIWSSQIQGTPVDATDILRVAAAALSPGKGLYLGTAIPGRKFRKVSELYGIELPEQLLVLWDMTMFGGAEDGFILTDRRLGLKELMFKPFSIPLASLRIKDIEVQAQGKDLLVRGKRFALESQRGSELAELLWQLIDMSQATSQAAPR
jgi:hypothetical protein